MANGYSVIFDGHELTDIFEVMNLDRGVRTGKKARVRTHNNSKHTSFLGYESELVEFPMSIYLYGDIRSKRRKLAKILNVNEPKVLIFGDEPDKFYYAFPAHDLDFEDELIKATGTITWEIYDGVAYDIDELAYSNENNANYITVANPGTEPMPMDLEAHFVGDCGFLGLETSDGESRVLFGDMEEVDGYAYQTSDLLFDDHLNADRGWLLNQGVVPPVTPNPLQVGTVAYKVDTAQPPPFDQNEGFAYPTSYGTGPEWHGPSLTKIVPADKNGKYAKNFGATWRFDFNTSNSPSGNLMVGHNSVTFINEHDKIICSVVVEDNNKTQSRSDLAVYVGDKRVWDTRNTTLFHTTQRPGKGNVMVEKLTNEIIFSINYAGIKKSFSIPSSNQELRKVTWYAAQYGTYPVMHNNLLRAINIRKHNVDNWQDIPNKFSDKDILKYGKIGDNIYCTINDLQGLQLRDVGSNIVTVPPGVSTVFIAYSDFTKTAPLVILRGRAMYV